MYVAGPWVAPDAFTGVTLYRNGVDCWRCRDIRGGVKQLGLACQALGAHAKARTVQLCNLMLEDFQLLPQHSCKPVLFERERLQCIGLDGKIRDSDGLGWHMFHDA